MKTLTVDEVISRWPILFHMAEADSWPSIALHGLRSTTALLNLFEVPAASRDVVEAAHRPTAVTIEHRAHGRAVVRDNKAINSTVLRRTLDGISEDDWYRLLNGRVFFWLTRDRVNRMRATPGYQDRPHDVLHVDTRRLLARYGEVVELSRVNSGAVHPGSTTPRGRAIFAPVTSYPWLTGRRHPPAELTVPYAVLDIREMVTRVERL